MWLVDDGVPRFVGDFMPEAGLVFLEIPRPERDDDLWVSVEQTDAPTDAPTNDDWWSANESGAA